jgi:hypothetical protein
VTFDATFQKDKMQLRLRKRNKKGTERNKKVGNHHDHQAQKSFCARPSLRRVLLSSNSQMMAPSAVFQLANDGPMDGEFCVAKQKQQSHFPFLSVGCAAGNSTSKLRNSTTRGHQMVGDKLCHHGVKKIEDDVHIFMLVFSCSKLR